MEYRLTIALTVCDDPPLGGGSVQRAALLAQQIVGSMYTPYGQEPPAYKDARIVIEPVNDPPARLTDGVVMRCIKCDRPLEVIDGACAVCGQTVANLGGG